MKMAVFELESWEKQRFESLTGEHEVELVSEALTPENAADYADAEIISTFIYSDLGRETLEHFQNLKMIATRSTGVDHIDLDYCCKDTGVAVANVPTYGDHTVAEHVFGLLLTLSHNLYQAIDRTRKGDFSLEGLEGFDLRDKTLGVIGTGSIGKRVIEIASGFGMKVLAFDVNPDGEFARKQGFEYADMDRLLASSDIITLHVPANDKTRNLISEAEFGKMKQGTVLINTARGAVVNTRALLGAISDGTIRAAGLDVLPEEPLIREEAELLRSVFRKQHDLESLLADHILLRLRNVVITPHSAFHTREAVERILETTVNNIRAFIQGSPTNLVNVE